jgi:hypothetical protein
MDIHSSIISQYGAALAMLRSAIESCPPEHWDSDAYQNRFWHLAYHVLFYTHLYLSPADEEFVPWEKGRENYNFLTDTIPWAPDEKIEITERYTRQEILEYHQLVSQRVVGSVHGVPLEGPSGFYWLPFDRFELHLYNLRHIQHHTGQLVERIRQETGNGVGWVGRMKAEA